MDKKTEMFFPNKIGIVSILFESPLISLMSNGIVMATIKTNIKRTLTQSKSLLFIEIWGKTEQTQDQHKEITKILMRGKALKSFNKEVFFL